jgi:LPS O-antigen subunit length determinant protein (WzzB/FepE family)
MRGLEIVTATRERFFEAELLRIAGVLAADADSRLASLSRAMQVARRQGAVLLQSRISQDNPK